MTKGTDLIAAERERQITEEGYTAEHDAGHAPELVMAGSMYATDVAASLLTDDHSTMPAPRGWPWAPEFWKPTGDPIRDLTKAGALIAAAIDSIAASSTSRSEEDT